MALSLLDVQIRQAAFDAVSKLASSGGGTVEAGALRDGFVFNGARIPLINPQRGIFKPHQMARLLKSSNRISAERRSDLVRRPTRGGPSDLFGRRDDRLRFHEL